MNSGKQNILTGIIKSGVFRKMFLFLFVFHLVVAHLALEGYVICIESSGKIHLESPETHQYCCGFSSENVPGTFPLEKPIVPELEECKDIFLIEHGDEENSTAAVKIIPKFFTTVLFINKDLVKTGSDILFYNIPNQQLNYSPQLTSYKTVSLLI